jgi:hypothetical protein
MSEVTDADLERATEELDYLRGLRDQMSGRIDNWGAR